MSDIVIKAENLGKRYIIGHQAGKGDRTTFREALIQNTRNLWNKSRDLVQGKPVIQGDTLEEVWALKDVSFEIRRGEAVGIIGRNGAGKSTLLKILSRITEPTTGRVTIRGRVASLLEVGTGFHSELSGRENIYLNGTILGMGRAEIRRKFDEIVVFAEVEKYLDTPVKRYSSGMYVRLAFAVAAHLEPEILVVDEVLAVGDAEFQKKCLGKMGEVATAGRTVLFVSHNMASIKSLCSQGIHLSRGQIWDYGPVAHIVSNYLVGDKLNQFRYETVKDASVPHIRRAEIYQNDREGDSFKMHQPIIIDFDIETGGRKNLAVGIVIQNSEGVWIHHSSDEFSNTFPETTSQLRRCIIPPYSLAKGKYIADIFLGIRNVELYESHIGIMAFEVEFSGPMSERITGEWKGLCGPGLLQWQQLEK